jgi:hypothetical protein
MRPNNGDRGLGESADAIIVFGMLGSIEVRFGGDNLISGETLHKPNFIACDCRMPPRSTPSPGASCNGFLAISFSY